MPDRVGWAKWIIFRPVFFGGAGGTAYSLWRTNRKSDLSVAVVRKILPRSCRTYDFAATSDFDA